MLALTILRDEAGYIHLSARALKPLTGGVNDTAPVQPES